MLAGGHPHWGQPDAERAAPWLPSLLCHPSDRRQPKPGGWPALAVRVPGAVRCGAEPVRWAAGTTRAPTPPWPGGPKSGRRRPGAHRSPKTNPRYRHSCAAHRSAHPARGAYQDRWLAWARRAPRALETVGKVLTRRGLQLCTAGREGQRQPGATRGSPGTREQGDQPRLDIAASGMGHPTGPLSALSSRQSPG